MPAVLVPPPRTATEPHAQKMRQTLTSDQGKTTYTTRAPTIEGVFGQVKDGLGSDDSPGEGGTRRTPNSTSSVR